MGAQSDAPLPLGDDARWEECEVSEMAAAVRDEPTPENVAVGRTRYRNTSMPHAPELQVTVTETLAESGEGSRQAAEDRIMQFLADFRVHFAYGSVELPDELSPPDEKAPGSDEEPVGSEDTTHITLQLLDEPRGDEPRVDEPRGDGQRDVVVLIDPSIGKGKAHIYQLVAPTRSASARIRATRGKVRMGIMSNDDFVSPLTTNEAGGGPSRTVSAGSNTPTRFKVRVRGLGDNNKYRLSTGWKRVR